MRNPLRIRKFGITIAVTALALGALNICYTNLASGMRISCANYSSCNNDTCLIRVDIKRDNGTIIGMDPHVKLLSNNAEVLSNNCSKYNCIVVLKADNDSQRFKFLLSAAKTQQTISDKYETE